MPDTIGKEFLIVLIEMGERCLGGLGRTLQNLEWESRGKETFLFFWNIIWENKEYVFLEKKDTDSQPSKIDVNDSFSSFPILNFETMTPALL